MSRVKDEAPAPIHSDAPSFPELLERLWGSTVPQLLHERARTSGSDVAFRYKRFGAYRDVTWADYAEQARAVATVLLESGLRKLERVALMGDPCPEWVIMDVGAQVAGAVPFGIYTTSASDQIEYLLNHSSARFFFAQDQEHVDKLLSAANNEQVELILVADDRALFGYEDPRIVTFREVLDRGRASSPAAVDAACAKVAPTDPAIVTYTSGTTGPPKAVVHTHRDLLVGLVYADLEAFPEMMEGGHRSIAHLALAHALERSVSVYIPLVTHVVPHIGETGASLQATMLEVQPTFFHAVPRVYQKIASQLQVAVRQSWWPQRKLFDLAMRVSRPFIDAVWRGERVRVWHRAGRFLARRLVFRHLLHKVGMVNVRVALVGAAPTPREVQALWVQWGVAMRNMYGSTETGPCLCQRGDVPAPGDVGRPLPPKSVALAGDGEILLAGRGLFSGYFDGEQLPVAAPHDESLEWFPSGDVGELSPEGAVRIVDRKKDIMITAGGKNLAPSEIENALRASPFISEAVLFADGRKFPTALLELDFDSVSQWARARSLAYVGFSDLATNPAVIELVAAEVDRANEHFSRAEQVKKFRIIPRELDPEAGDTTPTRKIRRADFYELFRDLVEEMYEEPARTA